MGYWPEKHAWQKLSPLGNDGICSILSSERYPIESAPRYLLMASTDLRDAISSFLVGMSIP